jgi:transaldolase
MLASGELGRLVADAGVRGATANPTIFEKALAAGTDYDAQIAELLRAGLADDAVFDQLAVRDLQQAADILRPICDASGGDDGFVSWEVSPALAHDADRTLRDARRLWQRLDRPNGMIKIPGTRAGLAAVRQALTEGINVNITLLFAVERYIAVVEAYLGALEARVKANQPIDRLRSVASFFVSRVDTLVDRTLATRAAGASTGVQTEITALQGQLGIANAKLAYRHFQTSFTGSRWAALAARGAVVQRPLWASTGTKDPRLPDTYYVDALIGPHTVNTVPLATLQAFNHHGRVAPTLVQGLDTAQQTVGRLAALGIDLAVLTDQLEAEGVQAFTASVDQLRQGIAAKRAVLLAAR